MDWAGRPGSADMWRRRKLCQPKWVFKRWERRFIETTQPFTCCGSENKRTWSPRLRVRESGNSCLSVHYAEKTKQRLKEPSPAYVNCKQSKKRVSVTNAPWPSWNWLFINEFRLRVISRNGPSFCLWTFLYGALSNVPALPWGTSRCIFCYKLKFLHVALLLWW